MCIRDRWGKCMGASTILYYTSENRDPMIRALILDAPYPTLESCFVNHAKKMYPSIPEFLLKLAMWFVDDEVTKLTNGMSIYNMRPVDVAKFITIPALYGAGDQDDLTPPQDIKSIFEQHAGEPKLFHIFKAVHRGERSQDWWDTAVQFVCAHLKGSYWQPQHNRAPLHPTNGRPSEKDSGIPLSGGFGDSKGYSSPKAQPAYHGPYGNGYMQSPPPPPQMGGFQNSSQRQPQAPFYPAPGPQNYPPKNSYGPQQGPPMRNGYQQNWTTPPAQDPYWGYRGGGYGSPTYNNR
eukprot:TRINITY_DN9586_c0_g1_i6.p1 TRINITY_DN9586_c0_g1~~TRINITY_DN9586_c0_g1_i6.p1  ORF type:complete len:292 (-),score=47.17 TRINITY_DN9586_c0_g1_i6:87-962(-)